MSIPVQNIYYLLSYAWDKLEEADTLSVDIDDYEDMLNLLTRVLINGSHHLLKRGLHADYLAITTVYDGIKGKLSLADSIKQNVLNNGKAICTYDEFKTDTLPNQIIKHTIYKLIRTLGLAKTLKKDLRYILQRFNEISFKPIRLTDFSKVRLNLSNYHYQFVLKICYQILANLRMNEQTGTYEFQDFLRDKNMAYLFENFLLNFYKKHAPFDKVKRENISWNAETLSDSSVRLPNMQTDICLESPDRKIIIDAKFYQKALQVHYDKASIRSNNLYQLYAYLKNIIHKEGHPQNKNCEGILIYPTVQDELAEDYLIDGHPVRIATINLNQHWRGVHEDLLEIIKL